MNSYSDPNPVEQPHGNPRAKLLITKMWIAFWLAKARPDNSSPTDKATSMFSLIITFFNMDIFNLNKLLKSKEFMFLIGLVKYYI
ncbi:hypothetical protein HanIR_Chr09g0444101 [Helianthus annuus]|nr:hypothetical protein HanIR_Chr09g0444101 [Helianthus annuus]